jgi:hypothetical protein
MPAIGLPDATNYSNTALTSQSGKSRAQVRTPLQGPSGWLPTGDPSNVLRCAAQQHGGSHADDHLLCLAIKSAAHRCNWMCRGKCPAKSGSWELSQQKRSH